VQAQARLLPLEPEPPARPPLRAQQPALLPEQELVRLPRPKALPQAAVRSAGLRSTVPPQAERPRPSRAHLAQPTAPVQARPRRQAPMLVPRPQRVLVLLPERALVLLAERAPSPRQVLPACRYPPLAATPLRPARRRSR
jgi:hypothetical protein